MALHELTSRWNDLERHIQRSYEPEADEIIRLVGQSKFTVVESPWGYGMTGSLIPVLSGELESEEARVGTVDCEKFSWQGDMSCSAIASTIAEQPDVVLVDHANLSALDGSADRLLRLFPNSSFIVCVGHIGFQRNPEGVPTLGDRWLDTYRAVAGSEGNRYRTPERKTLDYQLANEYLRVRIPNVEDATVFYILTRVPNCLSVLKDFYRPWMIHAQDTVGQRAAEWADSGYITQEELALLLP